MFKFFSEAMQELEHVVWPTSPETKKYMTYTVGVIVSMAFILMLVGYAFQTSLGAIRDQFPHNTTTSSVSGEATTEELNKLIDSFSGKVNAEAKTTSGEKANIEVTPLQIQK